jgi:hypothetical protein
MSVIGVKGERESGNDVRTGNGKNKINLQNSNCCSSNSKYC